MTESMRPSLLCHCGFLVHKHQGFKLSLQQVTELVQTHEVATLALQSLLNDL